MIMTVRCYQHAIEILYARQQLVVRYLLNIIAPTDRKAYRQTQITRLHKVLYAVAYTSYATPLHPPDISEKSKQRRATGYL